MKSVARLLVEHAVPVTESGCLLWLGATNTDGYGHVTRLGKTVKVHRLVWETTFGPIPAGQCVLHKCDVPQCVRLDHLKLGSHAENMQDMLAKNRGNKSRGAGHWLIKTPGRHAGVNNPNYKHGGRCRGYY